MRSMEPVEKCMRDAKMDKIQIDDIGHGRRIITELGKFELTGIPPAPRGVPEDGGGTA